MSLAYLKCWSCQRWLEFQVSTVVVVQIMVVFWVLHCGMIICFVFSEECSTFLVRVTEFKWMWNTSVTLNTVALCLPERVGNLATHKRRQLFWKWLTHVIASIMLQWPTLPLWRVRVRSKDVGQTQLVCTLYRSGTVWMWTPIDTPSHNHLDIKHSNSPWVTDAVSFCSNCPRLSGVFKLLNVW